VFLVGWFAWQGWHRLQSGRDGAPSWSPDGSRIAFYSDVNGHADLFVMQADGTGRENLTQTPEFDEGAPAFSPDGRDLAYDTDRDGNYEIYIRDLETGADRRLTNDAARDLAPAWHPDGDRLVFMSDRASRPEFDVFQIRADGTGLERLTAAPSNWFPQFSPDGTRLAMHVWRDVSVLVMANRQMRRLTNEPYDGMYPSWSPDGTKLAFMSSRNGRMEIFTMNADGSEQQRLVTMPTGGAIDPRWSPTGETIVFVHVSEDSPQAAGPDTGTRVLYTVELSSGRLRRLSR
jgi:Tol biopolymer transport system component